MVLVASPDLGQVAMAKKVLTAAQTLIILYK
jgi:hypothetical protein